MSAFCGNIGRGLHRKTSAPTWRLNARLRKWTTRSKRNARRWKTTPWIVSSSRPNKARSVPSNGWNGAASSACRGSAMSSRLTPGRESPDPCPGEKPRADASPSSCPRTRSGTCTAPHGRRCRWSCRRATTARRRRTSPPAASMRRSAGSSPGCAGDWCRRGPRTWESVRG